MPANASRQYRTSAARGLRSPWSRTARLEASARPSEPIPSRRLASARLSVSLYSRRSQSATAAQAATTMTSSPESCTAWKRSNWMRSRSRTPDTPPASGPTMPSTAVCARTRCGGGSGWYRTRTALRSSESRSDWSHSFVRDISQNSSPAPAPSSADALMTVTPAPTAAGRARSPPTSP